MIGRTIAKFVSQVAVGAHDAVSVLSPVEVPGRQLALGPAVVIEATGQDILDFLGEDLEERAEQIDELLKRCTQEELDEIFAALAEAMKIRAAPGEEMGSKRTRESSRARRMRRQASRSARAA
jgi:hypothetical protein